MKALNIDGVADIDHLARMEPIIAMKSFEFFVKSPYFSTWMAATHANVTSISASCDMPVESVLNNNVHIATSNSSVADVINVYFK